MAQSALNKEHFREQFDRGAGIVYGGSREKIPSFILKDDTNWNKKKRIFEADLRLVMPPDTEGFGYRVTHNFVGRPNVGNGCRMFTCPKFFGKDCIICTVVENGANSELANKFIKFPVYNDGDWVIEKVRVTDLIKKIGPQPLMIFMVIQPDFFGRDDLGKKYEHLAGLLRWWCDKKSVINRIKPMLENHPADYFYDNKTGHTVHLEFNESNLPTDMYQVGPGYKFRIPRALAEECPDPAKFCPKIRKKSEMVEKLRAMFGDDMFDFGDEEDEEEVEERPRGKRR